MANETPEENRERLKEMSRQEREGFAAASEGQLVANSGGEVLSEEEIAAREERLAPLMGRPFGAQSHTDRSGELLDAEAASTQDVPNRPAFSGSEKRSDLNEQTRQFAEARTGGDSSRKAGASKSRKSSSEG